MKLHLTWHGRHDNPIAVYEGDRQLTRGVDYAQHGDEFYIETERPDIVALRVIVVPRTQWDAFIRSEQGRKTQPPDDH